MILDLPTTQGMDSGRRPGAVTVGAAGSDSAQHSAMQALRESKEWLYAVFAASRDGVVLETGGRIVQANAACAQIFGYENADDLIGQPFSIIAPEEHSRRMFEGGRTQGGTPELFTFTSIRRDGRPVHLEASVGAAAVEGESHNVVVLRDVTARANLEGQLRHAQKMEAVGQLANGVAHDFNNLLTAIRCQTETILAYEQISPGAKEMLQQVIHATQRANNLTCQLLAFSRRTPMQLATVEINTLAGNLSSLLKRLISENIQLSLELQQSLPPVCADPSMLEQVIVNFAVNARDAMPCGGKLTIGTTIICVTEENIQQHAGGRSGEFIALRVSDTGSGITPDVLPHIFEPFFTTKEVGKGTGLGLATASSIIQQHNGWIEVESTINQGTTFTLFLPARRDLAVPAAQTTEQTGIIPTGHENLLLIEDDPQLRQLIRATLEKFGYQVADAGSGAEAMALWERRGNDFHLAMVDVVLPENVNGLELVEWLRARRPGFKAILMSGYGEQIPNLTAKAMPGVKLLSKPFDPQSLARIVRHTLDQPPAAATK